ncbi:hypothetical protein NIASO_08910 [Niabella soli DSM 19437]|uniref:Uncharacterized protein n=1 Tax=Niabella soli DSM 19437 TaxID=929713 RepID=W0F6P9_9BACT|nr:hypothetical protein NIASO_08910 [Niabella soli DSM 19437]
MAKFFLGNVAPVPVLRWGLRGAKTPAPRHNTNNGENKFIFFFS